jgi:hypothetical protein
MTITHPTFNDNPEGGMGLLQCVDGSVSLGIKANV